MKKRLSLEDGDAFKEAVSGIANLRLEERAKKNGSNTLRKRIRQLTLQSFHFLQENSETYTIRRPSINLTMRNRYTEIELSHDERQFSVVADMNNREHDASSADQRTKNRFCA